MASREELLNSIRPDMKLDGNFFMKVYGYELTWPGFADQALSKLEAAGCSMARRYYNRYVAKYEQQQAESIKPVAAQYAQEVASDYEKKVKKYENRGEWQWGQEKLLTKKLRLLKQKQGALNEKLRLLKQAQAAQSTTMESSEREKVYKA